MTHPARRSHDRPATPFTAFSRLSPATRAILSDAAKTLAMYDGMWLRDMAHELGCGEEAVRRAILYHGGAIRPPGAPLGWRPPQPQPEPSLSYHDVVQRIAWRAYRRLDRCPPDCPDRHRCTCLDEECELDVELEIGVGA